MSSSVAIQGGGVAACACAALLNRFGLAPSWSSSHRPGLPAIMLGLPTQTLIRDIFGDSDFVERCHPVRRRQTLWDSPAVRDLPHAAIVTSEEVLLSSICSPPSDAPQNAGAHWTICTSSSSAHIAEHAFGDRRANVFPITLRENAPIETCWVEALEQGWLFVLPEGDRRARLLAVGDLEGDGLGSSRLVAAQVDSVCGTGAAFASHPRLTEPLCGPAQLSCGSAALRFDPICGEGAGHALREAILAVAVIRASQRGVPESALLAHYRGRLLAGFARHLETCVKFYEAGRRGLWWETQVRSLQEGLAWCRQELSKVPPPAFRLNGFDLEPL